jgi:hypothetical protein
LVIFLPFELSERRRLTFIFSRPVLAKQSISAPAGSTGSQEEGSTGEKKEEESQSFFGKYVSSSRF